MLEKKKASHAMNNGNESLKNEDFLSSKNGDISRFQAISTPQGVWNQSQEKIDDRFRDYIWKYFSLHAGQRIQTFQVYVSLSTAILGGIIFLFKDGKFSGGFPGIILGTLLIFLSALFYMLDCRGRTLVKNAEVGLKFLDDKHDLSDIDDIPHPLRIFTRDDFLKNKFCTYSNCFLLIFSAFAVIGMFIIGYSSLHFYS
jgi:hypothetical protein